MSEQRENIWYVEFPAQRLLELKGSDGLDLLQRISTNDVAKLSPGSWIQTVLTNEKGRMIDVLWVGKIQEDLIHLLCSTDQVEKSRNWIEKFIIMENAVISISRDQFSRFVIVGNTESTWEGSVAHFREEWDGVTFLHLLVRDGGKTAVLGRLNELGMGRKAIEEYNDFCIWHGIPSGGREITADYNPLEAGLERLVSWTKGCYIGQEVIARLDTYKKVRQRLTRLTLSDRIGALPARILGPSGETGTLTSVTATAPFLGLGYLETRGAHEGEGLFVNSGVNRVHVTVKE